MIRVEPKTPLQILSINPLVPKNLFFEYRDENLGPCRYLY